MGLDVSFYKYNENLEFGTGGHSYLESGKKIAYFRKPWQYFIGWYVMSSETGSCKTKKEIKDKAEESNIMMDSSMGEFVMTKKELAMALVFSLSTTSEAWARPFGFYKKRKLQYLWKQILLVLFGPLRICVSYCN